MDLLAVQSLLDNILRVNHSGIKENGRTVMIKK